MQLMMRRLAAEREIVLYCDLHGHSRKLNTFLYGCNNANNPRLFLREQARCVCVCVDV